MVENRMGGGIEVINGDHLVLTPSSCGQNVIKANTPQPFRYTN